MGFMERFSGVVSGVGGALYAPVGLAYDLVRAPFTAGDDYTDGNPIQVLYHSTVARGGDMFGNLFGPNEGLGAALNAIPEDIRDPVGGGLQRVSDGFEWLGREGIREPIATAMIAASIADSPEMGDRGPAGLGSIGRMFRGDVWSQAHEMAQDTSVGQAVALAIGTRDILDENEVNDFANTDFHEIASGTTDFMFRVFLEPDNIVGGAVVDAARARNTIGVGAARGRTMAAPIDLSRAPRVPFAGSVQVQAAQRISESLAANFDKIPAGLRWIVTDYTTDVGRATAGEVRGLRGAARAARRAGRTVEADTLARRADMIEAGDLASTSQRFAAHVRARDIESYMQAPAKRRYLDRVPFMSSPSYARFDAQVQELIDRSFDTNEATALIRDRMFANHAQGDVLAHLYATADGEQARRMVTRFALGDMDAFRAAKQLDGQLAARMEDLLTERAVIKADPDYNLAGQVGDQLSLRSVSPVEVDRANYTERLTRIDDEIADLTDRFGQHQRAMSAFRALDRSPEMSRAGVARDAIKSSSFYQASPYARPLRVLTNMRPQHLLNVADPVADGHFERILRDMGMTDKGIAHWRGRFIAAQIDERATIYNEAVDTATRHLMREYGLTRDEIDGVLAHANRGRGAAQTTIKGGARYDGEGRAAVRFFDGEIVEQPIMTTQLQHVMPVVNWKRLRRELDRYGRLTNGEGWRAGMARSTAGRTFHAFTDMSTVALDNFMSTWKVGVLLRPAWTLRVVVLDEQMRMAAKFGALATLLSRRDAIHNLGLAFKNHDKIGPLLGLDDTGRAGRRGAAAGALAGVALGGGAGAVAGAGLGYGLLRHLAKLDDAGASNLTLGSYRVAAAYGSGGTKGDIYRAQVSSSQGMREFAGVYETAILGKWRENPDHWMTHVWQQGDELAQAKYREAWARALGQHHRQDNLARMALEGSTPEQMLDWLENTIEGRQHAARVPIRGRRTDSREQWVNAVHDQVVAYTGGPGELGATIRAQVAELGENPKQREWNRILDQIPEDARPAIHGPEFEQVMGSRSQILDGISSAVETGFEILGTMSTDELSRNPTFLMFYEQEMRRRVADIPAGTLDAGDLATMEDASRRFALRETRELLYDLAEESEFASMTRLLMPFFPAAQEVLTRWAGLAYERPVIVFRMQDLWNAPNRAGWTYTDDQGEDHMVIRIPEFARGLVNQTPFFRGALDAQGQIRLPKSGFNLILSNPIGFGPFVQIPASQMVREQPELEEAMRFILPFGPTDTYTALVPPVARDGLALAGVRRDENRAYTSTYARNLVTRLVQMQQGQAEMLDLDDPVQRGQLLQQVRDETNAFWSLRTAVRWVSPVAPIYDSPYQPYIDVYRSMSNNDAVRAAEIAGSIPGVSVTEREIAAMVADGDVDEAFLSLFGEEFFAVTTRLSESNNGVPPTIPALDTQEQFSDLITRHPDWGSVVIGLDGGGETVKFSRAAYDRQLQTPVQPGSSTMERERRSPEDLITNAPERLGWIHYSRAMDAIDAIRMQRGLPSLNVKGGEDLRAAKGAMIENLARRYPAWFAEFAVTDREAWNRKLAGARDVAADPQLAGRDDIRGLRDYLKIRDGIVAVLAARGSSTLDAVDNQDLRTAFDYAVGELIDRNAAFADLYYRMLERDPLDPDTLPDDLRATVGA